MFSSRFLFLTLLIFSPLSLRADDHECAVTTRKFAQIINDFNYNPNIRYAEIIAAAEGGAAAIKGTTKGYATGRYVVGPYLRSYEDKLITQKQYFENERAFANAYYGKRLQEQSFVDGTIDPVPSRSFGQNVKVLGLVNNSPRISKEKFLEEVRKIYGLSPNVEPDMDKTLLASERLWEANDQIRKIQQSAEELGNTKVYQSLAKSEILPKSSSFDTLNRDAHPTEADRREFAAKAKFEAEFKSPGTLRSLAGKISPETYGLLGGAAGGTFAVGLAAAVVHKISSGECGMKMTDEQAHLFSRLVEVSVEDGCKINPRTAKILATASDDQLEKACHDIPQLDGTMGKLLTRHFDAIKKYRTPTNIDIKCEGKTVQQMSFKMQDTVRNYTMTPKNGKIQFQLDDPSYPYGIKENKNKVNFSVDFDADKNSWGSVQSEGVLSSSFSDLPGLDAKDFVGYRLRHPQFQDSVESRKNNVIGEGLDNAMAMVPQAQEYCRESKSATSSTNLSIDPGKK